MVFTSNDDFCRDKIGTTILSHLSQTWCSAVIPDMLILSRSMSTLALRNMFMMASPSLSRMWSSNTTSSGKRTRLLPGLSLANTEALRDMMSQMMVSQCHSSVVVMAASCHGAHMWSLRCPGWHWLQCAVPWLCRSDMMMMSTILG